MLARLRNWFTDNSSTAESTSADRFKGTGRYVIAGHSTKEPAPKSTHAANSDNAACSNKNTVTRSKYGREHTETCETLKILDKSLPDADEAANFDPYNTGGFDSSGNWGNRS